MDFFLNILFFEFSEIKSICTFEFILIAIMLGWFLNFKIALRVWSSILSMKDSYLEYFEISRLLTILEKNLFRTSAVSNSVLTDSLFSDKIILSLIMILSENDGFIVFQKGLLSRIFFFFNYCFWEIFCYKWQLITWSKFSLTWRISILNNNNDVTKPLKAAIIINENLFCEFI